MAGGLILSALALSGVNPKSVGAPRAQYLPPWHGFSDKMSERHKDAPCGSAPRQGHPNIVRFLGLWADPTTSEQSKEGFGIAELYRFA